VVEDASLPSERRVVTTLAGLSDATSNVAGAALLIVGEAMALAQSSALPRESGDPHVRPEARRRGLG
jgi:uroporphyrin-III C-methyltransferase